MLFGYLVITFLGRQDSIEFYKVVSIVCFSLAGSFILASSVRMSDSIPNARTVWKDSFDDIYIYTGNTLKVTKIPQYKL